MIKLVSKSSTQALLGATLLFSSSAVMAQVDDQDMPGSEPVADPASPPPMPSSSPAGRPEGMSYGIGVQHESGADLFSPTSASVRIRLASGMTIEPFVNLGTQSQSMLNGDVKNAQNEVSLAAAVRIPLKSRDKIDLVGIGIGQLAWSQNDPDGKDNNSSAKVFALQYGVGMDYWVTNHWCLSFNVSNPFLSYQTTSQEISSDADTADLSLGLIWAPQTTAALHLFF